MIKSKTNLKTIVMLLSNPYNPDDRVRNEAVSLENSGFKVVILSWDRDCTRPKDENIDNIEIKRIQIPSGYEMGMKQIISFLRLWKSFLINLLSYKPKFVHCHDFDTYPAGVIFKILNPKTILILDAHENYYYMMKQAGLRVIWIIRILERLLIPIANVLISPSQETLNYYGRFGVKRIALVGNWKDPENYKFDKSLLDKKKRELGAEGKTLIAYIGLLDKERNVVPLLQALKKRKSVYLILGGKGDQEKTIQELINNLDNVYFPGYIDPNEVPFFTSLVDIIYYGYDPNTINSKYNAPNKLFEALAAGKVIIATDAGGELSNVIKETNCGLLLSVVNEETIGDAIDFLSKPENRSHFELSSRIASQNKYNWRKAEKNLVEIYK